MTTSNNGKRSGAERGDRTDRSPRGTLGTFAGVFTPSVLTILGLVLFLRMGFVVGEAGLARALLIVLLANTISVLTSVSLSAIATNLHVKGGGDYYVISRTLGVEFGGAIGLVLFVAQAVSIGFYAIGFGEAIATMAGGGPGWTAQAVAAGAVAVLFVVAWLGADWATRFQFVIMAVLFAAIAGFFAGGLQLWDTDRIAANVAPSGSLPFWTIFAIFFPAVTGFTQGVSLSGDLKNPGRSIPTGTFAAVGLSTVVYLAAAVMFAATVDGSSLVSDYGAMRRVSIQPWLVDAGVIAATLSSALASFLGAPRILQALASDKVFRPLHPFAAGHGPANNPRRGVLFAAGIAGVTVALGNLNLIAPIVSMFFLISYGLLNYATYVEARSNSPSFRPRFRYFDQRLSLIGALACLGAMVAIHPTAAVAAVFLLFGIRWYVSATVSVDRWADSRRSQLFHSIRGFLLAMAREPEHPRSWRPVILVFSDEPPRRERLLRLASWIEGGSGFTSVIRVVRGEGPTARREREKINDELRAEIGRYGFHAFPKAIVASDPEQAITVLLQAYGLGPVRANTVLLNWFDRPPREGAAALKNYARYLRAGLRFGCNVVILAASGEDFERLADVAPKDRSIDVWHRDNATGRLMLLLAYLMTRNEDWSGAKIRLIVRGDGQQPDDQTRADARRMLDEFRIDAEPVVVDHADPDELRRVSSSASMTFLPFRLTDDGPANIDGGSIEDDLSDLGIAALVLAQQDIQLDTEPDEGGPGEVAEALDAADEARKAADRNEGEAAKAAQAVTGLRASLDAARESGAEPDEIERLSSEIERAEAEVERARRRAAKAQAKSESAEREAAGLTGRPSGESENGNGTDRG